MLTLKSIFITGGTSGIGLATAKLFKSMGHRVGVCGRNVEGLEIDGIEVFKADVTNKDELQKVIREFSNKGLDILWANAGLSYVNKSRIPNFDVARSIIDVNLLGTLNTFEVGYEIFTKKKSGHLVATSSVAGLNGLPGVSAYSAAKSAVIKICESYNLDLEVDGIKTTCVIPGFVDTPLTRKNPHPMPFMVSDEFAAKKIYQGIMKEKKRVYFPFVFSRIVLLLAVLPRSIYRKILGMKKFNYSLK